MVAINTAKQLLSLEDRAWMGIESVFLSGEKLGQLFNLDLEGALLVQRVVKGGPADKAGLRGGSIPVSIQGQEILLGGDLILELGAQEACHSACLVRGGKRLGGLDRIPVKFLRGGKVMEAVINVSNTRRNFLKPAATPNRGVGEQLIRNEESPRPRV